MPSRSARPGMTAVELEERAAECYRHSGMWLAATFDLDLILSRRDALAKAERYAALGLEAEREARRLRRSTEWRDDG